MKMFTEQSGRWYSREGKPCNTMTGPDGAVHWTTIEDARRLRLLPSVTTVLGLVNQPELTAWKVEQALEAARAVARKTGESLELFSQRVLDDARGRMQEAAAFGIAFHAAAQKMAHGQKLASGNPQAPWLRKYGEWLKGHCVRVLWSEKVLVDERLGYAGTADLLIEHQAHGLTLVDPKTLRSKLQGKAPVYGSWKYQLAAYRMALGMDVRCMSLVVNADRPEAPVEHLWTEEEIRSAEGAFLGAHMLWCSEKGYHPGAAVTQLLGQAYAPRRVSGPNVRELANN